MIYNDKLWQSINKTNQESEYLQFLQGKSLLPIQKTLLTRSCLLVNFLALQDPQWLLYVHFKSSSSYYWAWLRPEHGVFKQNLSWFISLWVQCSHLVTMFPPGYNVPTWLQRSHKATMYPKRYSSMILVKWLLFWHLLVMAFWHDKGIYFCLLLYVQKFINELSFFFGQDYFQAVFLCMSLHHLVASMAYYHWPFPMKERLVWSLIVVHYIHAIFLKTPFLLLLVDILYIETGLPLCVAFDCFVLPPVVRILTSLARATF